MQVGTLPPRERSRFGLRLLQHLAVWAPLVVWGMGQVWRDATLATNLCFYLPSPVLAAWMIGLAGWSCWRGRRRLGLLLALAALAPLAMVCLVENQWRRPSEVADLKAPADHETPLRVVHWNIQWAYHGWDRVVERFEATDADAIFLSEFDGARFSLNEIEGYESTYLLGMAVLTKGRLSAPKEIRFWMSQRVWAVDWESRSGPVRVLMVDISSFPTIHRAPQLRRIAADIRDEKPDLVVGDFNTPRRALGLSPPPEGYRHAYQAAGAGWSYTWPVPAPVFAIDQLLLGARVAPLRYDLSSTRLSDHRMQTLEFRLLPLDGGDSDDF